MENIIEKTKPKGKFKNFLKTILLILLLVVAVVIALVVLEQFISLIATLGFMFLWFVFGSGRK